MKVVHCCKEKFDIYIGRWNPKFPFNRKRANPFKIGQDDGNRDDVVKKYEVWIRNSPDLLRALPELKDKTLGCWCSPHACHGYVLINLYKEFYEDDKT
jgi:hypothetical protein